MILIDGRPADAEMLLFSGGGVFTTLRSFHGSLLDFEEHLARLAASAPLFGIRCPDPSLLRGEALLAAGGIPDARVRIALLDGGRRAVDARPYEAPRAPFRLRGVPTPVGGEAARVKTIARAGYLLARRAAAPLDDALLLDREGRPLETTVANFFLVRDGALLTPPLDAPLLPGIGRARLLGVARGLGIPVEERPIAPDEADDAAECFLSNALFRLHPVAEIEGRRRFSAWPVARRLREAMVSGGLDGRIIGASHWEAP